jgi:L-seryl-tRNA(Ser) seleniumtransferase
MVSGAGVRRTEAWEYLAAAGPKTAGVLYVLTDGSCPPLTEVVEAAHRRAMPVLVDAAAELPPRSNLREILSTGADLVAFSGGKAIQGPQSTGILCGRRDLIRSAFLQLLDMDDHPQLWDPPTELIDRRLMPGMPRHGIGRGFKVSKEEIVALIAALRRFADGGDRNQWTTFRQWLQRIADALEGAAVECRLHIPADGERFPRLEIVLEEAVLGKTAFAACRELREGSPPVYPGHSLLQEGALLIHPLCLKEEQIPILIRRLMEVLQPAERFDRSS